MLDVLGLKVSPKIIQLQGGLHLCKGDWSTWLKTETWVDYALCIISIPLYIKWKITLVISAGVSLVGEVSRNCYNLIGRWFLIFTYLN